MVVIIIIIIIIIIYHLKDIGTKYASSGGPSLDHVTHLKYHHVEMDFNQPRAGKHLGHFGPFVL